MKQRTVKQGKRNFKPEHRRQPKLRLGWNKNRSFALYFRIPKESWFDTGDFEKFPILKLGGITFFRFNSIRPNQDAILVGYKPAPEGKFWVYSYINFRDKSWQHSEPILIDPDKDYVADVFVTKSWINFKWFKKDFVPLRSDTFAQNFAGGEIRDELFHNYILDKETNLTGVMYNVSPYHGGSSEESKAPFDLSVFTEINSK